MREQLAASAFLGRRKPHGKPGVAGRAAAPKRQGARAKPGEDGARHGARRPEPGRGWGNPAAAAPHHGGKPLQGRAERALAEGGGLTPPVGLAGACVAVVSPGGCRAPRDAQRDLPRRSRARRGRASGAPAPQPPRCARRATRGAPQKPPRRRAGLLALAAALRAVGKAERASRAATQPRGARGQQRDTARPFEGRARSAALCSPRSGCTGRPRLAGAGRVRLPFTRYRSQNSVKMSHGYTLQFDRGRG